MIMRRFKWKAIHIVFGLCVLLFLAIIRYANIKHYSASVQKAAHSVEVSNEQEDFMPPIPTNDDGSPNIENILDEAKSNIKSEFSMYNFTYSGVKGLDDLLLDSGGRPMRHLILATWRSGSSFFGDLFTAIPGTYYYYEPLLNYGVIQIRSPPLAEKALSNIKKWFKCDFENMDEYFKYAKDHVYEFNHNPRLWEYCKYKSALCYDADFSSKFCRLFPIVTMKLVRLRLYLARKLLEDEELNIKVVLLVRDPRAVMQSRRHRSFCRPSPDCSEPERLCADMASDFEAAQLLLPKYPDRLMIVRFEDLALNPKTTVQQILKFLKVSSTPSFEKSVRRHTKMEIAGHESTFKISRDIPFKWMNALDFEEVDRVQKVCDKAMEMWGYQRAYNASHMVSKYFYPIRNETITDKKYLPGAP